MPWTIERLGEKHDRAGFSCGNHRLDEYLRSQAGQDARRFVAVTFVAVASPGATHISGYYTMSATSVDANELPAELVKRLPRYPRLPAALLGRLAVDSAQRGQRLGRHLLLDALHRAYVQSRENLAVAFVVVDAIDGEAADFYRHYRFVSFADRSDRLFLPMRSVARLFEEP